MTRDATMRRALRLSVFFNIGGALLFAFPGSLGQLAGLPVPVPRVYGLTIAMLVSVFAGAYLWLSRQPVIDRPMVAMLAIGKASFFLIVFVCWLAGDLSAKALGAAVGDLVFAVVFARWLFGTAAQSAVAARPHAV